jgi:hypothetical protein
MAGIQIAADSERLAKAQSRKKGRRVLWPPRELCYSVMIVGLLRRYAYTLLRGSDHKGNK